MKTLSDLLDEIAAEAGRRPKPGMPAAVCLRVAVHRDTFDAMVGDLNAKIGRAESEVEFITLFVPGGRVILTPDAEVEAGTLRFGDP